MTTIRIRSLTNTQVNNMTDREVNVHKKMQQDISIVIAHNISTFTFHDKNGTVIAFSHESTLLLAEIICQSLSAQQEQTVQHTPDIKAAVATFAEDKQLSAQSTQDLNQFIENIANHFNERSKMSLFDASQSKKDSNTKTEKQAAEFQQKSANSLLKTIDKNLAQIKEIRNNIKS